MTTIIKHLDDNFEFGKFKGTALGEVLMYKPDYLRWVVENVDGTIFKLEDSAITEIRMIFPEFEITEEFETMREKQLNEPSFQEYNYHKKTFVISDNFGIDLQTYGRYSGTYAQDVAGYSDDEIDTIFDGEPDAYWNID